MGRLAPKLPKPARFDLRAFCIAPMKLPTLKTNVVPVLQSSRVKVLAAKAGTVARMRGDAWMAKRKAVQERDGFACAACGAVRSDHEVDHRIPLEQGGSNDESNLQLLCSGPGRCHHLKTKAEAKARAGK